MCTSKMATEDLLADIVSFLNNTLASEDLSPTANQRRLMLLQKILSKDSVSLSYVDMSGCHKISNDFETGGECYEELESSWSGSASSNVSRNGYSQTLPSGGGKNRFSFFFGNNIGECKNRDFGKVCDTTDLPNDYPKRNSILSDSDNSLSPSSVKSEDSLEITSISASAIKYSALKCGNVYRKEKVLFVEHTKRLWAALLGTNLYIYTSEKDTKPLYSVNVDEYNARPITANQTNKKEFGFEIICPGKKTYQFFTNSKSEMDTWILSINHSMPLPQTSTVTTNLSTSTGPLSCADPSDCNLSGCSEKKSYRDLYRYENIDNLAERELPSLPSLPLYLHYDTPNPLCKAVDPTLKTECIRIDGSSTETFYHSIEESLAEQLARYDYPIRKDAVSRNKENTDAKYNPEDNIYYNILGHVRESMKGKCEETSRSSNLISNDDKEGQKSNTYQRNGISRIRQLIQKMEEINNQNNLYTRKPSNNASKVNVVPVTGKEDIYELVNSPTYVNINA